MGGNFFQGKPGELQSRDAHGAMRIAPGTYGRPMAGEKAAANKRPLSWPEREPIGFHSGGAHILPSVPMTSNFTTIEVLPAEGADDPRGRAAQAAIRSLGIEPPPVRVSDLYFVLPPDGPDGARGQLDRAARLIFSDPITQVVRLA